MLRFKTLFGVQPTFLGVGSYRPIEAAGSLLDVLDILTNFPLTNPDSLHVVLVNVAPRGEDVQQKWDNGTPFCYFRVRGALVLATYEERSLALLRDHGVIDRVELLDIPTVTTAAMQWGELSESEAFKITHTQFRSLEFLPLAAYWLCQGRTLPSKTQTLDHLVSNVAQVWSIDNFDDIKTTLVPEDVGFEQGKAVTLADGTTAICYARLADVPEGVTALTIGSSGYGSHRFLELVIGHRGRATATYRFVVGAPLLSDSLPDKVQ